MQMRDSLQRSPARRLAAAACVAAMLLSSPVFAQAPESAWTGTDLFEPVNRVFGSMNATLVTGILDPVGQAYVDNVPVNARLGVANVFANLREPVTILSDALLLDGAGVLNAAARFSLNSTAGILGYYDVATPAGFPFQPRRLDEVFCRANLPEGPYFVLPFFGAANLRDSAAILATNFLQYSVAGVAYLPYRVLEIVAIRTPRAAQPAAQTVDYETLRDSYIAQRRAACESQRNRL